jgi:hypothetical protein
MDAIAGDDSFTRCTRIPPRAAEQTTRQARINHEQIRVEQSIKCLDHKNSFRGLSGENDPAGLDNFVCIWGRRGRLDEAYGRPDTEIWGF